MGIHQRTHPCMAKSRAAAIVQLCSAGMIALVLSFLVDATLFDVLKGTAGAPNLAGNFTDPEPARGLCTLQHRKSWWGALCGIRVAGPSTMMWRDLASAL